MNFENELETALRELDVTELDSLIGDIELPRNKQAGRRIAEKSVRKEKITMSKKIRKKTVAGIAAVVAALGCTVAAGAYVYDYFAHQRQNVAEITGDSQLAEELESKGLLDNEIKEFDHLMISKDTKVLCDGGYAMYAISVIPVDAQGNEIVGNGRMEMNLDIDAEAQDENGNTIILGGATNFNYNDEYLSIMDVRSFSQYCESLPVKNKVSDQRTGAKLGVLDYTFEKNVRSVKFVDSKGRRIILSEIGLLCFDGVDIFSGFDADAENPWNFSLMTVIGNNGEQKVLTHSDINGGSGMPDKNAVPAENCITSRCRFKGLIDPDEVTAIIIDGERFEPEK